MFSRIEISHEQLVDKKQNCRTYFILNCLFFSNLPTSWTLRNIVPVHTREMKNKYRMGLWLNSVEGREVKHISIARYPSHTHYQTRWEQIFLHEYVSLPWLREKGYLAFLFVCLLGLHIVVATCYFMSFFASYFRTRITFL